MHPFNFNNCSGNECLYGKASHKIKIYWKNLSVSLACGKKNMSMNNVWWYFVKLSGWKWKTYYEDSEQLVLSLSLPRPPLPQATMWLYTLSFDARVLELMYQGYAHSSWQWLALVTTQIKQPPLQTHWVLKYQHEWKYLVLLAALYKTWCLQGIL